MLTMMWIVESVVFGTFDGCAPKNHSIYGCIFIYSTVCPSNILTSSESSCH